MDVFERLLEHDRWATLTLLGVCGSLSDEQLDRDFDIGHRTLRATFDHLIFNIAVWGGQLGGEPLRGIPERHPFGESISGLTQWYEQVFGVFARDVDTFTAEGRAGETFVDHFGERPTLGGTVLHLTLHNAEHRSEVLHMLQRLGIENLPEIDYLLWELSVKGK